MSDLEQHQAVEQLDGSTGVMRDPLAVGAESTGGTMLMQIDSGRFFLLDDIGCDVWQRLETPCSFGDLVEQLAADYEADRVRIGIDVGSLIRRMAELKLVTLDVCVG